MWWNPEVGDSITGTIAGWGEFSSKQNAGEMVPVVVLATPEGEIDISLSRMILRDEITHAWIATGEKLGQELTITYNGQPQGKRYHHYTVEGPGVPEKGVRKMDRPNFLSAPDPAPVAAAPAPVEDDDIPF